MNNLLEKRLNAIPIKLVMKLNSIDRFAGQWSAGVHYKPQLLGQLKKSVLITSTGASTRIEGAKLSDEDIEKLMQGMSLQKFADRDKQEVQGYYELLENVFDSWEDIALSEGVIKHFHKELLKYVVKDSLHRGEYKKKENKVQMINSEGKIIATVFDTTPAYLTPKRMTELVEWTNRALKEEKYPPLLIIGGFLVEFLAIHPFQDGNGRISRILTNLLLLKNGYLFAPCVSHEKLIEDNKPNYYLALRKSQKTLGTKQENITDWLEFFFDVILKQAETAVVLLSKEAIDTMLSQKQLAVWTYLQTVQDAAPDEIATKTKIGRPTVNQALTKLLKLKKIERIGLGRATRYRKAN